MEDRPVPRAEGSPPVRQDPGRQDPGRQDRQYRVTWLGVIVILAAWALTLGIAMHGQARDHAARAWRRIYDEDLTAASPATLAKRWSVASFLAKNNEIPTALDEPRRLAYSSQGVILRAENTHTDLVFSSGMLGNLHVEWDAEALDQGMNLNCFIGGRDVDHCYFFHQGSWDDPANCVVTFGPRLTELGRQMQEPVAAGVWYHYAMEREDRHLRLWRDQVLMFDLLTPDDLDAGGQVFGFDTVDNRVRIARVVVAFQPLERLISPLAVGDKLLRLDQWNAARDQYREVRDSYPGTDLDHDAEYRMALCALRAGDSDGALDLLRHFEQDAPDSALQPYAWHERWRIAITRGDQAEADRLLKKMVTQADPALLSAVFSDLVDQRIALILPLKVTAPGQPLFAADAVPRTEAVIKDIQRLAKLCRVEGHHAELISDCSGFFRWIGRADLVFTYFPDDRPVCAMSLLALGRYTEVRAKYPMLANQCAASLLAQDRDAEVIAGTYPEKFKIQALAWSGRLGEALTRFGDDSACAQWLLLDGRADEALRRYGDLDRGIRAAALAKLGRVDEALALDPGTATRVGILVTQKHYDEALALVPDDLDLAWSCSMRMRLDGDIPRAQKLEAMLSTAQINLNPDGPWFAAIVIPELLATLSGKNADWRAHFSALAKTHPDAAAQTLRHGLAFLAGDESDAAFAAQPYRHGLSAWLDLMRAVQAEFAGKPELAGPLYRAVQQRPWWQQNMGHAVVDFVAWRVQELKADVAPTQRLSGADGHDGLESRLPAPMPMSMSGSAVSTMGSR